MEQVPKIVLQRLRAGSRPEVHPDPDLLNAFAENVIGERERGTVMEHLAQCADCRELVALAQPPIEEERVAVAAAAMAMPASIPVRSSWLRAPMFRWVALTACALVVAAGTLLLRHESAVSRQSAAKRELKETELASNDTKAQNLERRDLDQKDLEQKDLQQKDLREKDAQEKDQPLSPVPPPPVASSSSAAATPPARAKTQMLDEMKENPAAGKKSDTGGRVGLRDKSSLSAGAIPAENLKKQEEVAQAARAKIATSMERGYAVPATPPATAQSVRPDGGTPATQAEQTARNQAAIQQAEANQVQLNQNEINQNQSNQNQSNQNQSNQADANQNATNDIQANQNQAEQAKTNAIELSKAKSKPKPKPTTGTASTETVTAESRSGVVSGGSFGAMQGRAVGGVLPERKEASPKPAAAVLPQWTLSPDGTALLRSLDAGKTWQAVPTGSQAVMRALAALGSEIWVGGAGGALYHSANAGKDWKKVAPSAQGQVLSADIVGIEFIDAVHGKVTTATHEVWTTNDAGQNWGKQ